MRAALRTVNSPCWKAPCGHQSLLANSRGHYSTHDSQSSSIPSRILRLIISIRLTIFSHHVHDAISEMAAGLVFVDQILAVLFGPLSTGSPFFASAMLDYGTLRCEISA